MFNTEGVQQTLYIPHSLPRPTDTILTHLRQKPRSCSITLGSDGWDANHQSCLQQQLLQVQRNHLYIILNAMATGKMQHAKGVVVKEGTQARLISNPGDCSGAFRSTPECSGVPE